MTDRYRQPDPIGLQDGMNRFGYANQNALRFIDPFGLWGKDAHDLILSAAFMSLGDGPLRDIMRGSAATDALKNQFGDWSFLHAMRNPGQSVAEAKAKACAFIKDRLAKYRAGSSSADSEIRSSAYFALGEALHPVMDSTSPMHRGWQEWHMFRDGMNHGNGMGSKEGLRSLTPELLNETLLLIRETMEGDACFCAR